MAARRCHALEAERELVKTGVRPVGVLALALEPVAVVVGTTQ